MIPESLIDEYPGGNQESSYVKQTVKMTAVRCGDNEKAFHDGGIKRKNIEEKLGVNIVNMDAKVKLNNQHTNILREEGKYE
jgi:hypothetical protein